MSIVVFGSYAKALVMTTARVPTVGETVLGRDFRQTFGGKGSDMAVQAARLGLPVAFFRLDGSTQKALFFSKTPRMICIIFQNDYTEYQSNSSSDAE